MLNLLAVSDWRTQPIQDLYTILEETEPKPDLLLYAGDDLSRFKDSETGTDHLTELAKLTKRQLTLFVRGNDDVPRGLGVEFNSEQTHDLHQSPLSHGQFVFYGQEGSVKGPGIISYTESEVENHLSNQRKTDSGGIPVLVTHTPPHGILDIGSRFGQQHIGSTAVRDFIDRVKPSLTVCGHCHQFGGRAEETEYGAIINIASHDSPGDPGRYVFIKLIESDCATNVEYEFHDTRHLLGSRLTDLIQIGRRRASQMEELGITEPEDITESRREELEALPGSSSWHVDRWLAHRRAFENDEVSPLNPEEFEDIRREDPVLIDIETDLQQSRIWLVGVYDYKREELKQFFNPDDEEALLDQLREYLAERVPCLISYYGGNYFDEQCLKQRFREYGFEDGIKYLEHTHDVGITAQQELFGPFNRHQLDVVADSLGFEYEDESIDGFEVGGKFTSYLLDEKEPDWERLKQYNRDDVNALRTVIDYIQSY